MDTETKRKREAEWMKQHELNDDQFEKLIEEKFNRAKLFHESLKVREHKREFA